MEFVLFMSCVCHAFASVHCCLVVTCWERAGSWLLFVMLIVLLSLSMWYSGSGVELNCIIPELYRLSYFPMILHELSHQNIFALICPVSDEFSK